jgi:branched-chain amino acid transport system permease protein
VTWTYFLGWQFVALGVLIVVTIVYFQQGIFGWIGEKYPTWFAARGGAKREDDSALAAGLAPHPEGAE